MSDISHSSSEQRSLRDNSENLNLREEVKRLRRNEIKRERELEEIKGCSHN